MSEIFKKAAALYGKIIIVNIMCFFIIISFNVLITAAFTENIGYKAYGTMEGSEQSEELYTYYYDEGEDTQRAKFEKEGYKISESKIRSEVSATGNTLNTVLIAVFCTAILMIVIYPQFWQLGTADSNLVHFKHKKEDKLKGLKAGLIATVPGTVLLTVLLFIPGAGLALYKFLNSGVYAFIGLIVGKAATFGDLAVWQIILLFLLKGAVPLIAYVSYLLGYKNISLSEKFIYKKNIKK